MTAQSFGQAYINAYMQLEPHTKHQLQEVNEHFPYNVDLEDEYIENFFK